MSHSKQASTSSYAYLTDHRDDNYDHARPAFNSIPSYNAPAYSQGNHGARYSQPPPPYPDYIKPASSLGRCNPRNWSKRTWIGAGVGTIILLIIIIVAAVVGAKANAYPSYSPLRYHLADTFVGQSFFDNFNFFYDYDPAQGLVHYSNPQQSVDMGLVVANDTSAILRVDNKQNRTTTGRHSARIYSKHTYNSGLFIFDVLHTPYGCASWPAVWLTDQANWPANGEIDVIEAVNRGQDGNEMTLHTTDGCSMDVKRKQTGETLHTNCYNATNGNAGCGVRGPRDTFGKAVNDKGGGVYAMEWRSAGIRMWFFPRAHIPMDITNLRRPQPDNWGEAMADFPSTSCDIDSHFRNQSITINIDVCGSWAGRPGVYSKKNSCPGKCDVYQAFHPEAFDESYWEFQSIRVYQAKGS